MIKIYDITFFTKEYNQWIIITKEIENLMKKENISSGILTVVTRHTTTGITVNEGLECLESDMDIFLNCLVPEDAQYSHARMLHSYGSTAGNPTGHIKALLTGNHCHFPVENGTLIKGDAQEIYFCEFDGPSKRTIQVIHEY